MKSALKVLWMMYILFPFRFKGIGIFQNIIYYGISILFARKIFSQCIKKSYDSCYIKNIAIHFFIMLALTFYALIMPEIAGTYDFSYFSSFVYYCGRSVILAGTLTLCDSFHEYINLYIKAISLYVIFSIILLFPAVRSLYMNILSIPAAIITREDLFTPAYYTRFGLQGFSGFGITFMCSIASILCCYMISISVKEKKSIAGYFVYLALNIVGTFFYGRVGMVVSLLLAAFTIFYITFIYRRYKLFLITCAFTVLLCFIFVINADKIMQSPSLSWIFEGFLNYIRNGKFSTGSSDVLQRMYLTSINFDTFIWGDAIWQINGGYYKRTDVGWMRPLLFGGIFFEVLYYALVIPLFIIIYKARKTENGIFFIILCMIALTLFEIKGEILLTFANTLFSICMFIMIHETDKKIAGGNDN